MGFDVRGEGNFEEGQHAIPRWLNQSLESTWNFNSSFLRVSFISAHVTNETWPRQHDCSFALGWGCVEFCSGSGF